MTVRDPDAENTPEFISDEPTKPVILIDRSREKYSNESGYRDELNAMRDKYDSDLAYRALYNMVRRQRHESSKSLAGIADASLQTHQATQVMSQDMAKIGDLIQWKHETDTALKIGKWILGFVIAATLGSIVVVVTKIYVWGETSGALENRVLTLERNQSFKIPRTPNTSPSE